MRKVRIRTFARIPSLLLLLLPGGVWAQSFQGVVTGQYDNYRSGANLQETILTPSNVSAGGFGLLFTNTVDANIFAQPLYVPNVSIKGGVHNVVIVATLRNSVYAFDADTAQSALWHVSLGPPAKIGFPASPLIGILSTPVIDPKSKVIFVVALSSQSNLPVYTLYALNLLTGKGLAHIAIQAAVTGTGDNSQSTPCAAWDGGAFDPPCVPFKALEQLQRPALLEDSSNSTIYVGFGTRSGSEAVSPYHGWLLGYQFTGTAFTQTFAFNSTANATQTGQACSGSAPPNNQCGHGGGIWMSGRGPALDPTGIYVVTGNGGFGGAGTGNWGESVLRLDNLGSVQDSYTPNNYVSLNAADLDLGDAGAILFDSSNPAASNLALAAGKTGKVYVLNRSNLGGFNNGPAVQTFIGTTSGCGSGPGQSACYEIHGMAYWARASADPLLYLWAWGDSLRVWDFHSDTNQFKLDANQGNLAISNFPGGAMAISANGDSGGILWAVVPVRSTSAAQPGALYAFDATNVSTPLWNSSDYWYATKFTSPTVANGKVYIATSVSPPAVTPSYSPELRVYGLCGTCTHTPAASELQKGAVLRAAEK
ncbi:MAG TPA: hypothetical protein VMI94_01145 [Bryobacteraceae bacterium]|nr:hypothetical protein [Bryobacteraceae bacterium]